MAWELMDLLDRIELNEDLSITKERFDIAEIYGFTIVFGPETSAEKH
jgi:hypothetical protein